jgi:hypothetical protein
MASRTGSRLGEAGTMAAMDCSIHKKVPFKLPQHPVVFASMRYRYLQ